MTLTRLLFEPTLVRSPLRVLGWWESRRPLYNLAVGAVGLGTLAYVGLLGLFFGQGLFHVPWFAVVGYGVLANVCYSLGPAVELAVEKWLQRPVYGLGPALFRHGLVFSLGLTALPAGIATVGFVAKAIFG